MFSRPSEFVSGLLCLVAAVAIIVGGVVGVVWLVRWAWNSYPDKKKDDDRGQELPGGPVT